MHVHLALAKLVVSRMNQTYLLLAKSKYKLLLTLAILKAK